MKYTRTGAQEGTSTAAVDKTPVALVFNGVTHAAMIASPTDLEDFILSFALSEGIINSRTNWRGADVETHPHGLEVHAEITSYCFVRSKERCHVLTGPTDCGLCSIESLQTSEDAPQPFVPPAWLVSLANTQMLDIMQTVTTYQPTNALTDGLHATGWMLSDGNIPLHALKDMDRYNALDRLINRLTRLGVRPSDGFIVMTGRVGFELARKYVQL